MKKLNKLVWLVVLIIGNGCEGYVVHECEPSGKVEVTGYEFVANTTDVRLQNIDATKSINLVIANQADYDHYVVQNNPAVSRPTIDFTQKILLAGSIYDPKCGEFVRLAIMGDCNEYNCSVVIRPLDCAAFSTVQYFTLIDKTDSQIKFDIQYEM